jgi:hypothetical protein
MVRSVRGSKILKKSDMLTRFSCTCIYVPNIMSKNLIFQELCVDFPEILKKYNHYIYTCEQLELPMEREWNRGSGICRQFLPIRHSSCCSILIPMVVISDDTGNTSYNNLKSIPIWKIYISHTFPQALGVSRRTFDSNNLCYWLSNFRVNPPAVEPSRKS